MLPSTRRRLDFSKTIVMGVINVTPDSFFDGGQTTSPPEAVRYADALLRDGADILDVGGESTRPGASPVSPEEECARILPVVEALVPNGAYISIDTYHADTARRALQAGARMINDVTALRGDKHMAETIAAHDCDCVLMHMLGTPATMQQAPAYQDLVGEICGFFEERLRFALAAGIREERIWIDPGFGFGKTVEHNLAILRQLAEFKRFGRPVLIGTSNKSTIGTVLGLPAGERSEGTAATVAVSILNGADAVRVHDVKAMARVARMTDAIVGKGNYHG
jgi:dihydropteroate synthase